MQLFDGVFSRGQHSIVHGRQLLVDILHQRTLLTGAGNDLVALQLQGVVFAYLIGQSFIIGNEEGGQQFVLLRLVAQIVPDGLCHIELVTQFQVGGRDVLGAFGINLGHHLKVGHHGLALIVGHTLVERSQLVLQRSQTLHDVAFRHGNLRILVLIALLTVFCDDGIDDVGSTLLGYIFILDVDNRRITTAYCNVQSFFLDEVHHGHGLGTLDDNGYLVVLHFVQVGSGVYLDVANRSLESLTESSGKFILELIIVFLDFVNPHVSGLRQIDLHPDIILVGEVLEFNIDRTFLTVKLLFPDTLFGVAHVKTILVNDIQQQPRRLHGIELVIDVR